MASFENTSPAADSVEAGAGLPHSEQSIFQGCSLYSLDELRAAEATARKAAEEALKLLPAFPAIPGDKPHPQPQPRPKAAADVKPDQPTNPAGPPVKSASPALRAEPVQPTATRVSPSDLSTLFEKDFATLDTDNNGFVSEEEIDAAVASSKFTGKDALMVDVLKKHRSDLQSLSNDEWGPETNGISRQDMAAFETLRQTDASAELVADVDKTLKRAGQALDGATCREPFPDKANPLASIKPEAVIQGRIHDGRFLAALASLAKNNPQAITSMIKDNGDRTYTVTFPGDPDNPVTVSAPTDAELGRYASATQYGTWPAILEKAYGMKRGENTVEQDGADERLHTNAPMRLLSTGGFDTDFMVMTDKEELDGKLSQAFQDKVPVTAGVSKPWASLVGAGDGRTDDGVPRGQSYSVVGYDSKTQTVTLRNPRGYGEPMNEDGTAKDGKNDGTFTMTLDEFQRNFTEVDYGQV